MLEFLKDIFNPQAKPKENTQETQQTHPLETPSNSPVRGSNNHPDGLPSITGGAGGGSFSPPLREGQEGGSEGSPAGEASNDIDTQHAIVDAVLQALRPFRGSNRFKGITLWATDSMYVYLLRDEAFENLLRSELETQLFTTLSAGPIEVKTDSPASGSLCAVADKVFFAFHDATTSVATYHRLTVKAMPGMGSLVEPEYILDSANGSVFHIGRGEVFTRGGRFLQNDVAIREDDPDPDTQAQNNQVSHTHAKIVYADGRFFLQALPSGCRSEGGSPTKIAHGKGEPIEIRDIHSRFPLSSGDFILLGKAVCLKISLDA